MSEFNTCQSPTYNRPANPYFQQTNDVSTSFFPKTYNHINDHDDDFVPSKEKTANQNTYTNIYLKKINFRKEITNLISKNIFNDDSTVYIADRILNNIYFEEQLERSTIEVLSESLKIEIDRNLGTNLEINHIINLVSKYFI